MDWGTQAFRRNRAVRNAVFLGKFKKPAPKLYYELRVQKSFKKLGK
jgi:hypothetical protein